MAESVHMRAGKADTRLTTSSAWPVRNLGQNACKLTAGLRQHMTLHHNAELATCDLFKLVQVLSCHDIFIRVSHWADMASKMNLDNMHDFVVQREPYKLGPRFSTYGVQHIATMMHGIEQILSLSQCTI